MRRSLCGWALALAVVQRLPLLCGGEKWAPASTAATGTITTTTTTAADFTTQRRARRSRRRSSGSGGDRSMAFSAAPSFFEAATGAKVVAAAMARRGPEWDLSVAIAVAGIGDDEYPIWGRVPATAAAFAGAGAAGGSGRRCCCRRSAVSRLEAKRSEIKAEEAEFRAAAKELAKMEAKKEKKTKERARRREERQPKPPRGRVGDEMDDQVSPAKKAGQNPFKKEKIVSKFDVNDIRKVEFVGSYDDNEEIWPRTNLPEIAFLGRSNVGKSSMLNTLFGEAVAKVSKTPGRTRQINIFKAKNSNDKDVCYFADLPGYGYAKMSKDKQRTIEKFLGMYLARRSNLKLLVLLADSRREPLASDAGVLEYAEDKEDRLYKILMVATKVDKLNNMEALVNIKRLQEAYGLPPGLPISFSAVTGQGKKEIWSYIRQAAASL